MGLAAGCGDSGIGACSAQPDISGAWTFQLTPLDVDAGIAGGSIARSDTIAANLSQVKSPGAFNLAKLLYGTLTSGDKGFFDALAIPMLMKNNGSKTGSALGCELTINVPVNPPTDDNSDPGPIRISLAGTVTARGQILGIHHLSSVIQTDDPTATPRQFSWTGTQP